MYLNFVLAHLDHCKICGVHLLGFLLVVFCNGSPVIRFQDRPTLQLYHSIWVELSTERSKWRRINPAIIIIIIIIKKDWQCQAGRGRLTPY